MPPKPVQWPVQVGLVPDLASAFQPRRALREQITAAWQQTGEVVLTQRSLGTG